MSNSGRLIGISVLCLIIFIIIPLIIAGISLLIYRISYKRKIKKRLSEGMEANIKPMMSPLLWGAVMVYFGVKAAKQKQDLAVYPVAFELADEELDDSPFAGYKFGDEIKGYEHISKEYGELKLEFYVLNNSLSSILPNVLVAADYTGDDEDVVIRQKVNYGVSESNWSYTGFEPNRLTVLDVGGYRGEFTYAYELYYGVYDKLGIDDTNPEFFNKEWEYMDSHSPDTCCKIDFNAEELFGRGAGISSPQLGIEFYHD